MRGRIIKGLGANVVGQLLGTFSKYILPPLFIYSWGVELYGTWLILSSIVAYLVLSDIGGQLYVVNKMTQLYGIGDLSGYRNVLNTGLIAFIVIPVLVFLLFISILYVISLDSIINNSNVSSSSIKLVLSILAFQFVITLPQGLLLGVYRSIGKLPKGVMIGNVNTVLQLFGISLGLLNGFSIVAIAILQVVPFVFVSVYAVYDIKNRHEEVGLFDWRSCDLATAKSFLKPSFQFFLMQISQVLTIQGLIVLVGIILNPVYVVLFSTLRTIVNTVKQVLSLITHSVWPEITNLDKSQDYEKLLILFRIILRTCMFFSILVFGVLHYYGDSIYHYWLGDEVYFEQQILDILLVYSLVSVFWLACSHMLMASNKHAILSRVVLSTSILTLVMSWLGAKYLGIAGVGLGMLLSELILPFWFVPVLMIRSWGVFKADYFIREMLIVLVNILLVFASWKLAFVAIFISMCLLLMSIPKAVLLSLSKQVYDKLRLKPSAN